MANRRWRFSTPRRFSRSSRFAKRRIRISCGCTGRWVIALRRCACSPDARTCCAPSSARHRRRRPKASGAQSPPRPDIGDLGPHEAVSAQTPAIDIHRHGRDDEIMLRASILATLVLLFQSAGSNEALSVLHIKIVLADADGKATPVPHHALLVSDNPASAPPRRVVTALDGTAELRLRPGSYTVESDRPIALAGKSYEWMQVVNVRAGREAVLELTASNAEVGSVTAASAAAGGASDADPSALLMQWQDSVVALWTPTTHASGFVIDAKGLIATNQRVVGTATSIEVQLAPAVKLAATVLTADVERDVAILWAEPKALASLRPLPLPCDASARPTLVERQDIFTIGTPLRGQKAIAPGTLLHVEPRATVSDLILARGSAGGPIFAADGRVVGITSALNETEEKDNDRRGDSRVVDLADLCEVVGSAATKMTKASPPGGTLLPMEPARAFPVAALQEAAKRRV